MTNSLAANRQSAAMGSGVGPLLDPFPNVERIAVLRGGGLGDLMFAYPALSALSAAYPEASITLLGVPLHAELLRNRPGPVAEVEVLPYASGVRPGLEDGKATADFFSSMRSRNFDLAVQIHGGGRNSNPFLLKLGARHTVGTRTPDAVQLERSAPYVYYQNEFLRSLEVVGLAGAAPVCLEPQLTVTEEETAAGQRITGAGTRPLLVIHPGATDPRRRWPASSFATVAAWAARDGSDVVIVGDDGDAPLAAEIVRLAGGHHRDGHHAGVQPGTEVPGIRSLAGQLSLSELTGVLSVATVVIGNDSGPRHLAQAVGTPTVGIFWVGNVINAGAMGRVLHRVHLAWATNCPVCGVDVTQVGWTAERCEHDDSFVQQIQPDAIYDDVRDLTATTPLLRGR
ncbi:glycosyltransferase family 9 protein [Arthrobacter sp. EH-1B-1]|uniref:Glycosyltransferase family 9 protein n=1 Tax=Arthrobacter vasquezii TaxID=2977629 RepID=A0ABT6CZR5_9MICC|nr:glycosyltransferase family 9 protein [Arthrobacter vasquezii]MDF9279580.1 glycosyltransferase family 9 protein [Arthrobacter vasquezii]